MTLDQTAIDSFRSTVYAHFEASGRDLPWRHTEDPYHILVSEIMLQQTQVPRVIEKFREFIGLFPTPATLADAPLAGVLAAWQGLGYNRRALSLHRAAQEIVARFDGVVPDDPAMLATLPGIGPYTAAAVTAFAFDHPAVFIETNIRSVFIHHFFPDRNRVPDADLLPLVEQTLDRTAPRRWYSALMDYGTHLKSLHPNPSRKSAHHTRQSSFAGSTREVRGGIIRLLVEHGPLTAVKLIGFLGMEPGRVNPILDRLTAEGLILRDGRRYRLPT